MPSSRIDGWFVNADTVKDMSNCRLRDTHRELQRLLAIVEEEIEQRLGQGGGGLK